MKLELGSLAQWVSAIFAGLSFVISALGFRLAYRASKQAKGVASEVTELKVQISETAVGFGGQGGSGGIQGGCGGGGGGAGAPGGQGGSVTLTTTS